MEAEQSGVQMISKAAAQRLGEKSSSFVDQVPTARLQAFAQAVGAKFQGDEAPPTYLTTCRKGEFEFFEKLNVPLSQVLHIDQEYDYAEPVLGGDILHYQTELESAVEKAKGKMLFLVFVTPVEIEREGKRLFAGKARSTIMVRS